MDQHQHGAHGGGKKNKKKKRSKDRIFTDNSHAAGESEGDGNSNACQEAAPQRDKGVLPLPTHGRGNGGRQKHQPRPILSSKAGQFLVNVAEGGRTVTQVPVCDSSSAQQNKLGARQTRTDRADGNANANANSSRYGSAGKARAERKGDYKLSREQHQQQDSSGSQGQFVHLEGKELLRELAEHRIFELRKKNPSFPNAKYFCRLCEYHLDRPQDCERHVSESRHRRKKEASDTEGILEHIPEPTPQQIRALDSIVESVAKEEGLTASELESRQDTVHRLQAFIRSYKEDVTLRLYGSSLTGVGLKGSDVNVDVSGDGPAPSLLINVFTIIHDKGAPEYIKAQSDYNAKIPVVRVTDVQTGQQIVLAINSQLAVLTSSLLRLYSLADPRVTKLAVTLRCWAKICHLDRQEEGTLPPFALNIMVVYFLQQTTPPVLGLLPLPKTQNETKGSIPVKMEDRVNFDSLRAKAERWKSDNKCSVGELWLQLLKFYCLEFDNTHFVISILQTEPMTRQEKKWHSKKLAIEDPFAAKKNIASSMANSLIFEYFQSCLRKAYEYFGMPRDKDGNVSISMEALRELANRKTAILLKENQECSTSSSGTSQSDKESLQKEGLAGREKKEESGKEKEGNASDHSGSNSEPVVIQPNRSTAQRLKAGTAGEESSGGGGKAPKSSASAGDLTNDGAALGSALDCEVTAESLTVSSTSDVTTDSVPACSASELDFTTDSVSGFSASDSYVTASEMDLTSDSSLVSTDCESPSKTPAKMTEGSSSLHIPQTAETSHNGIDAVHNAREAPDGIENLPLEFEGLKLPEQRDSQQNKGTKQEEASQLHDDDEGDIFWYKFTEDVFTSGKGPAVICGYCEQEGHIKANCPDDKLPAVKPLPPMTPDHLSIIDRVISKIIYDFRPTDIQLCMREHVVRDLENFVRQIYPDACFSLFGSSCNGFGFHSSDLDICMTLRGKTVEDIDVVETIETVAKKLMQKRQLYNVISIPTAKVPIVKFTDRETRLEGDISLYNTLAQRNTKLLWCYSEIDPRVKILGYAVKVFAKVCYIGDASRGSLSSYGYILMMLHYLQQCKPPVIPVLQELRPEGEWPEYMVEGCNTWFFDDLRQLPKVWPGCGKNKQSIGELWMGFLRFYLEDFDWKGMVVTVRQRKRLTKFEKMWTGKTIAVEDPFDWTHNLGGGLSRKMNNYIYKTFVKGRAHFGTPVVDSTVFVRYRGPSDYFFDVELLTDGKPPNDRGCRMCGKIGHLVKDCPNRPGNKRRQQAQKEKETKQKNSPQENSSEKRGDKGQDKEAEGQGSAKVKSQEEVKGRGHSAPAKSCQEPKDQGKAKVKSQEKLKDQSSVKSKDGGEVRGQGNGEATGQGHSKQDSGSKVDGNGHQSVRNADAVQPSTEAKTTYAVTVGGLTSTTNTTTTTAAVSSATSTSSDSSSPRGPPGSGSMGDRSQFQPEMPSQHDPRPALFGSPGGLPSPHPQTSTPVRVVRPGMRPPGMQIDVQQLFSLVQQSGGSSVSLSSRLQPKSPKDVGPNRLLTPEQQVAIFGGQSLIQSGHSSGSPQQLGAGSPSGTGASEVKIPVSSVSLFQSQPPTPAAETARASGSPQQMTPLPMSLLMQSTFLSSCSQSQLPAGGGVPGRTGAETGYAPQQMTPMPPKASLSRDPSQPQLQQQALQQQQPPFLPTVMQMGLRPDQPAPRTQAQNPLAASQLTPATSVSLQSQPLDSQSEPSGHHHQQTSFAQQQRLYQNHPAGPQQLQGQPAAAFPQHQSHPPPPGALQHQGQVVGPHLQYSQSVLPQPAQPSSQPVGPPARLSSSQPSHPLGLQHQGQPMGPQPHQSQPFSTQARLSSSHQYQSHPPGGLQHQSQPMGPQPQHSQPAVLQPHQSQLAGSQAQPLTPQQMAYLQLQQMTTSMAAPRVPVFGQSPPGIFTQPRVAGHPFYQMVPGVQSPRRDGSSGSTDSTGHGGSPHGNL